MLSSTTIVDIRAEVVMDRPLHAAGRLGQASPRADARAQEIGLENPAATRTAETPNPRDAISVVVVSQFLALADVARRHDPDRVADDVGIAVRTAGMIDVARDVAADRGIAHPPAVDRECPDAVPRQVPLLAPPALRLRDQLAF